MDEKTFTTFGEAACFARHAAVNFGVPIEVRRKYGVWVVEIPESDDGIPF